MKKERGIGTGLSYIPWILTGEFSSQSNFIRVKGRRVPRVYHLLSSMEYQYFTLLDFADNVSDIREQYPLLPREDTCAIAESLGVRHPAKTSRKFSGVLTTDFLITCKGENGASYHIARTVKPKKELLKLRVLEKFEIERIYWEERKVCWGIITEDQIDQVVFQSFSRLRQAYDARYLNIAASVLDCYLAFEGSLMSLEAFLKICAEQHNITYAEASMGFMFLLYHKKLRWDYTNSFSEDFPLLNFTLYEE
jgi:hypothetical protein